MDDIPNTNPRSERADGSRALARLLQMRGDTAKPIYQQLEEQLVDLIRTGTLQSGTTLPAERHLADSLGISRTTVQHCYNNLRRVGILSSKGRLGSIVQPPRLQTGMDRLKGFSEEMRELGRVPSSVILQQEVVSDRSIASIFGLPSTASILKLVRVRSGDGVPLSREAAWYNLAAAPNLVDADLTNSVYDILARQGVQLTHCDQSIEAASPSPEECRIFGFERPQPCLLIKRRTYSKEKRMIEYVEGLFRGDAYVYKLKLDI